MTKEEKLIQIHKDLIKIWCPSDFGLKDCPDKICDKNKKKGKMPPCKTCWETALKDD